MLRWLAIVLVAVLCVPAVASAGEGPFQGSVSRLDPSTARWMTGSSWRPGCPVPLERLRLVRLTYVGFDGR
ncbi:MAG: M15 family metallopeptidase, partial [Actinomycetota bacterium]